MQLTKTCKYFAQDWLERRERFGSDENVLGEQKSCYLSKKHFGALFSFELCLNSSFSELDLQGTSSSINRGKLWKEFEKQNNLT